MYSLVRSGELPAIQVGPRRSGALSASSSRNTSRPSTPRPGTRSRATTCRRAPTTRADRGLPLTAPARGLAPVPRGHQDSAPVVPARPAGSVRAEQYQAGRSLREIAELTGRTPKFLCTRQDRNSLGDPTVAPGMIRTRVGPREAGQGGPPGSVRIGRGVRSRLVRSLAVVATRRRYSWPVFIGDLLTWGCVSMKVHADAVGSVRPHDDAATTSTKTGTFTSGSATKHHHPREQPSHP
jgi:hypothetical protein